MAKLSPPLQIDASNRGDHYYLVDGDECFYFHEYTPRKGYGFSDGNQLVSNLKKSVLHRGTPQYKWKGHAIGKATDALRASFDKSAWLLNDATFAPIPPSKAKSHPEYDDRIWQIVRGATRHHAGVDVRELVVQTDSYEASHLQTDGYRLKPHELQAMYELDQKPPKDTVVLVDDMLTTGAHFVACRNAILEAYPSTRVIGMFVTRRVLTSPFEAFEEVPD